MNMMNKDENSILDQYVKINLETVIAIALLEQYTVIIMNKKKPCLHTVMCNYM